MTKILKQKQTFLVTDRLLGLWLEGEVTIKHKDLNQNK